MRALLFKLLLPVIAVVSLIRPFYGLFFYIAFNIIRPEMLFWGAHTANIIFKITSLCSIAGYLRQKKTSIRPYHCREFWLLLWISIATAVSILFSDFSHPRAWFYAMEIFKIWVICWLILGLVSTAQQMRRMQYWILCTVALLSVWGVEQHFRGNVRLEGLGGDAFPDSNGVAAVVVLFFPIVLNKLITARNIKVGLVWLLLTIPIGLLIIFTGSRGGFVGMAAGVLVLMWATRKKKVLVCLIVAVIFGGTPYLASDYKQRLSTLKADNEERDMSSGSRLVLWQAGGLVFMDNPFS